jgi:hypothetical protein
VYIFHGGLDIGFWNFEVGQFIIECLCMAPLTPAMMVMRGLVFHPLFFMVLISGSYFVCLCKRACSRNLLWQYVNSINWIVWVWEGVMSTCVWFGAPSMDTISGLSLA